MADPTDHLATVRAALAKADGMPPSPWRLETQRIALGNAAPAIAALVDECERLRLESRTWFRAEAERQAARADAAEAELSEAKTIAAPRVATVGELLATAPVGAIVECQVMRAFRQVRANRAWFEQRWSASDGSWSDWYSLSYQIGQAAFRLPARLVPADQADADPSTRGPLEVP